MDNIPQKIRDFVLQRDGYACRACNSEDNLTIHHIVYRSYEIDHSPDNLVLLCWEHHRQIHDGFLKVVQVNGNFFFGGKGRIND